MDGSDDKCVKGTSKMILRSCAKRDSNNIKVVKGTSTMVLRSSGKTHSIDPKEICKNKKAHTAGKVSAKKIEKLERNVSGPFADCSKNSGNSANDQRKNMLLPRYSNRKRSYTGRHAETEVHVPKPVIIDRSETQKGSKKRKLISESGRQQKTKPLDSPIKCAFCNSFRTSEVSGPMVHYMLDGKPTTVDETNQSEVVHAHSTCINWCPKVYFNGDTAINLEKELSRASKLNCSKCGQKGAALGCFYKLCRKSYHFQCAYKTPGIRWDDVNLLVLCPSHASKELPFDKSEIGKMSDTNDFSSPEPVVVNSDAFRSEMQCNQPPTATPTVESGFVLCGSDLSANENDLLFEFAELTGASVVQQWEQNVTHVIASTDQFGACRRTFKVLMATLKGKWVLNISWVKDYMESEQPVAEHPYEIRLDNCGCVDGPKRGRIRAMHKATEIFSGLKFYLIGEFSVPIKGFIEELVSAAGGTILSRDDFIREGDSNARKSSPTSFVVYNEDPLEEDFPVDFTELLRRRSERAKAIATKTGARAICHTWLWDAIATSSLEFSNEKVG